MLELHIAQDVTLVSDAWAGAISLRSPVRLPSEAICNFHAPWLTAPWYGTRVDDLVINDRLERITTRRVTELGLVPEDGHSLSGGVCNIVAER